MEKEKYNIICKRCHRKLKDENSKKLGFGKVCYEKYMKQKRNYLFEMGGENNMEFNERDLIIFYELHNRINLKSRNIGVLGDSKKFKRVISNVYKQHKERGMQVVAVKDDKYIFIVNDIEYSYIKVQTLQDLRGRYFRKFI